MSPTTIQAENAILVLVDVQPWFLDRMHGDADAYQRKLEQLLLVAEWYQLPVIATVEEPLDRKGRLPEGLQRVFPDDGVVLPKQTYDLCGEPAIRSALTDMGRSQVIVAGGETDVCVLESVLGLLSKTYGVFLLEDCLYSSTVDVDAALFRMRSAGAIPLTYKTLFYELCVTDDPDRWSAERRRAEGRGWVQPEEL